MARSVSTAPRRRGIPFVTTATLAFWRLRQTWRLLLVSGLGALAAVMLVCAVPLFSQVATSAGLRTQLAQLHEGPLVVVSGVMLTPSSDLIPRAQSQIDRVVRGELGAYLAPGAPAASTEFFVDLSGISSTGGVPDGVDIVGADLSGDTSAYSLVAGRLPSKKSGDLEVAVSQDMATRYGLAVGMTQSFIDPVPPVPPSITAHIVGILAQPPARPAADQVSSTESFRGGVSAYFPGDVVLASNDTLVAVGSALADQGIMASLFVQWTYHLDLSRLSVDSLDDLPSRLQALQVTDTEALNADLGLNLDGADTIRPILSEYQERLFIAQIPVGFLLIQVIGLVLLFIALMVTILVDSQADAIAVLRSRGAPRTLVLRAMTVQSVGVGLLALVAGPLLALALVGVIAGAALPSDQRGVLNLLSNNPLAAAWSVRWFALAAAACAIIAMIVSTRRAAGNNVLALRRESARVTGRPLWQRLNLDLVFAASAVLGYAAYTYIISYVGGYDRTFLSVVSLFATLALMLAAALLFLRFFPLLLGLLARLAARGRTAAPVLAIGQMARAPKQASRMMLLLAFSAAFTLSALIFAASQAQRVLDVALYQTGADFRGSVSPAIISTTGPNVVHALSAEYGAIRGVTSATPVYDVQVYGASMPIELLAVDADTFAKTAIWSEQDASAPLTSLMAALASRRSGATDVVPAVVDDVTWQMLNLTQGASFTLGFPSSQSISPVPLTFLAEAHVQHIPPINDGEGALQGYGSGGILVDFATLNAIHTATTTVVGATGNSTAGLTPNGIWLRTAQDAASLASVRAALTAGPLAVGDLLDRRKAVANAVRDALYIDLLGVLAIAAGTALTLALVGILLGSWLSARTRLISFALLRAFGSEPAQLAGVLLWEQGIIYTLALGLGVVMGFALAAAVLPVIIFTNGTLQQTIDTLASDVPPIQIVVPWPAVGAVLGGLLLLCGAAVLLMTRVVAHPSIGQTMRLNED